MDDVLEAKSPSHVGEYLQSLGSNETQLSIHERIQSIGMEMISLVALAFAFMIMWIWIPSEK